MGVIFDKLCGGNQSHDELFKIEGLNSMVNFECEGFIYVKYYDQNYKKRIQSKEGGNDASIGDKFYGVLFIDRLRLFTN